MLILFETSVSIAFFFKGEAFFIELISPGNIDFSILFSCFIGLFSAVQGVIIIRVFQKKKAKVFGFHFKIDQLGSLVAVICQKRF